MSRRQEDRPDTLYSLREHGSLLAVSRTPLLSARDQVAWLLSQQSFGDVRGYYECLVSEPAQRAFFHEAFIRTFGIVPWL